MKECNCLKIRDTIIHTGECINSEKIVFNKYFDFKELADDFLSKLKYGDTLRSIGEEINISASTLSRVTKAKTIDIQTAINVSDFIGKPIDNYIKTLTKDNP